MSEATLALRLLLLGDATGGLLGLSSEMSALMGSTVGAGLAFAGFTDATLHAVDAGKDLEASMVNVQLMVRGAADLVPELTTAIIDLADHSTYTSAEVADAFSALGKHLITAQEILGGVGKAAIDLGLAMGTDAAGAADILAQSMQIFGNQGMSAIEIASKLDGAFHNGIPSVDGLRQALANAGGSADAMGVKFDDFLAVMDLLAPRMGSASQAATAMRYVMATIADPTDKAAAEMKKLGLATLDAQGKVNSSQFYDAKGNFIGLAAAIELINTKIKDLNPEDKAKALGELFNVRSGQGIRNLLGGLDDLNASYLKVKGNIDNVDQVQKDADKRMSTYAAHAKEFGATIQDAWARIGITILPPITQLIGNLNTLADKFNKASSDVHKATAIFLIVGAVLSGIALIAGVIGIAFATGVAPVIGVALLVAVGIAGIAAAIAGAWYWFQQLNRQFHITDTASRLWKDTLKALAPWVKIIGDVLGGVLKTNLKIVGDVIQTQLMPAWKDLQDAFKRAGITMPGLGEIFKTIGLIILGIVIPAIVFLVGLIVGVISFFITLFSGVVTYLSGFVTFVSGVLQFLVGLWQLTTGNIVLIVTGQWDKLGKNTHDALTSMGKGIEDILHGIATMVVGIFQMTLGAVIAFVGGFIKTVIDLFKHLADVVVGHSIIPDMVIAIASWFLRLPGMVAGGIYALTGSVVGGMQSMAAQATSVAMGLVSQASRWGSDLVHNIASGILGAAGAVRGAVGNIAGIIASVLHHTEPEEGPLAGDSQWGHHFVQNLVTGMNAGVPQVQSSANRIAGAMGMVQTASSSGSGVNGSSGVPAFALYIDGQQIKNVVVKRMSGDLKTNGAGRYYH